MSRAYAPPIGVGADPYRDVSDVDDRQDLDEAEALAWAKEHAKDSVQKAEYWYVAMDGEGAAWRIAECLAACMKEIDKACSGDTFAMTAITTALSRLQQTGIQDAAGEQG